MIDITEEFKKIISKIILEPKLHAKWLNTLSFLENAGARKIAKYEDPSSVSCSVLKHAAEEFRHAYYFKIQALKLNDVDFARYSKETLFGHFLTIRYLHLLDIRICRYLKQENIKLIELKNIAYLLVTYAIETRAKSFYNIYDQALKESSSNITIKSIILEEQQHLRCMEESVSSLPKGEIYKERALKEEFYLCKKWILGLVRELQ